ncbi:MAG: competence protein ComEC family protein [Bacteroidota bacterium]|nr:competence protein ComEC family protein [Bacteroidota bacterium]
MNYFSRAPLIRLIIPFLAGIICFVYLQFPIKNLSFFIALLFLVLLIYLFTIAGKYKHRWIFGILISFLLFTSGYQLTSIKTQIFNGNHFAKLNHVNSLAIGRIKEPLTEKENSFRTTLEILRMKGQGGEWTETTGIAIVYFQKDTICTNIGLNDLIIFENSFKAFEPPSNPGEFNYMNYMFNHFIYHQAYLKSSDWEVFKYDQKSSLEKIANNTRNNLLDVFKKYKIESSEFAVLSALMMGYKDKLDQETIRAYSGAGAMHVLAVSGLHVGIIYFILNFMLFFFNRITYGHLIKATMLLLFLWSYALLTGLSPSVLRATAMFSFIIIGKAFLRNTNIYNTLAASAFVLLLYNPYLVMEVGFQLSYLAVIGIVYLQPKIYNLFTVNNWLLNKIWALTSVSLAAQLATFPLGLLYFHQFPNYFIISNIVVIPAATLVIYSGMVLLIVSGIESIAEIVAKFLNFLIKLLNESVIMIEKLPYSITEAVHISILQTWLIYAFIISGIAFFVIKKNRYLFLSLTLFALYLLVGFPDKLLRSNQKQIIVYNIKGHSAINFINGSMNTIITDLSENNDQSKIQFHMKNNWIKLGVNDHQFISPDLVSSGLADFKKLSGVFTRENFFKFHQTKIGWISENTFLKGSTESKVKLDYIILSNNPKIKITEILNNFEVKTIIIDSSNSEYKAQQFTEQCTELNIDHHTVFKKGAFIADLTL